MSLTSYPVPFRDGFHEDAAFACVMYKSTAKISFHPIYFPVFSRYTKPTIIVVGIVL